MSFNWGEFVWAAEQLCSLVHPSLDSHKQEALLRSAISRAYYAAYKECSRFHCETWGAVKKIPTANRDGIHKRFLASVDYNAAIEQDDARRTAYLQLSQDLRQLYNYRIRADYGSEFDDVDDVAPDAIEFAKNILNTIASAP